MRLNLRYPAIYLFNLGCTYWLRRRCEEAMTAGKKTLARNSDFPGGHVLLAIVYSELGREKEARAEAAEILRISPDFSLVT